MSDQNDRAAKVQVAFSNALQAAGIDESNLNITHEELRQRINQRGFSLHLGPGGSVLARNAAGDFEDVSKILADTVKADTSVVKDQRQLRGSLRADMQGDSATAEKLRGIAVDEHGIPMALRAADVDRAERIRIIDKIGADEYARRRREGDKMFTSVMSDEGKQLFVEQALATSESAMQAIRNYNQLSEAQKKDFHRNFPGLQAKLIKRSSGQIVKR